MGTHPDALPDAEVAAKLFELGFNHCVHLLSGGGEPETMLYLKYFADEDYRQHWLDEFPGYDMPVHEDPPHNRDRLLPRPQ